jgi:hypothetical protein
MNPKDWKFPMRCPTCGAEQGTPINVVSDDVLLTVDMHCGECHHEWKIDGPSPAIFLRARQDRRRLPRVG